MIGISKENDTFPLFFHTASKILATILVIYSQIGIRLFINSNLFLDLENPTHKNVLK